MTSIPQRICSLLPSATEIVYALGLADRLVAVTHECDFPAEATSKPVVTRSVIEADGMTSRQIDQAVRESLESQATIYHLDQELLKCLAPDLVLTQELCTVCAVGTHEVRHAVSALPGAPRVISLEPQTLSAVLDSILLVGRVCGVLRQATEVVTGLQERLTRIQEVTSGIDRIRVLTLEWLDPPFVGGHWVPEMVVLAGGFDVLGRPGEYSRQVTWEEIQHSAPEVVIAMPCGFGLERTRNEIARVPLPDAWHQLPGVRNDRVFAVDGSAYFNRPGPRLVDGVEILAALLHPDLGIETPAQSWSHVPQPVRR